MLQLVPEIEVPQPHPPTLVPQVVSAYSAVVWRQFGGALFGSHPYIGTLLSILPLQS